MTNSIPSKVRSKFLLKNFHLLFLIPFFIFMVFMISEFQPSRNDWSIYFQPATYNFISGRTPYEVDGFYYPPWVLIPLIPLILLPVRFGAAILYLAWIIGIFYVARSRGASLLSASIIALSPQITLFGLGSPNIEWMVAIGSIIHPMAGLFFLLSKPQIGIGLAFYWIFTTWQKKRLLGLAKLIWPVAIAFFLSFQIYGFYFIDANVLAVAQHNRSIWPYGIPIGILLIIIAIRRSQSGLALSASPFLAPFLAWYSWVFVPLGFLPNNRLAIGSSLLISAIYLIEIIQRLSN